MEFLDATQRLMQADCLFNHYIIVMSRESLVLLFNQYNFHVARFLVVLLIRIAVENNHLTLDHARVDINVDDLLVLLRPGALALVTLCLEYASDSNTIGAVELYVLVLPGNKC